MLYNEKIRQIRQLRGLTQEQVAKELEITQQQYFKYEKGINELPIRYLKEICRVLNVSSDEILGINQR